MEKYIDFNLIGDITSNGLVDYEALKRIPAADVVSREQFNYYIDLYSELLDSAVNIINFLRERIEDMSKTI